ncbi:MAG: NFACT family protein [Candidatus Methanomethyliaceae archaeon]|nr:NFACT family protein [Candidatus Methanomethyliaceae archaeon]MDW7970954.1 ribosome rescue protein RqcH [Nitrososphaerota archaeon]
MKLCLTSIDLLAIVRELKSLLINARMENIYNLDNLAFIFRFHTSMGNMDVIFELGRRVNITNYKYPLLSQPSRHAMIMRSLLLNSFVLSIDQINLDRIISFKLKSDRILNLYLEVFGEGNVIITDEFGKILYALHQKKMRDRSIITGALYSPPPIRGKSIYDEIKLQKVEAIKFLVKQMNLPPEFIEEVLFRCSINPKLELSEEDFRKFLNTARQLIEEIKTHPLRPNLILKDGEKISIQPIEFLSLPYERVYFESFNAAVDEYFSHLTLKKISEKEKQPIEEELKKLERILKSQEEYAKELERKINENRKIGELILSNLIQIQNLIDYIIKMRKENYDWNIILKNSPMKIIDIDTNSGMLKIIIDDKEITLDLKRSASENMNKFFSLSKEYAEKLKGLKNAIKETQDKIDKLRKGLQKIQEPIPIKSMKKEWYEKFRWTFSSQGFLIIGGKDARQNEILVKKYLESRDIFAHSEAPGGSVVIVKSNNQEIPEETKREAVAFAVVYSKAWKAGLSSADGYWVYANQVTKSPPSGEYLGKGAFMIYGERNYVRNISLIIHLGVKIFENSYKIIVGNESFVKENAVSFVKLTPGKFRGKELVKKIKELLLKRANMEYHQIINLIPDSEILALIPFGEAQPM